jgi:mRNA-degrading endonuclease RelE of RelBE toxin-antitoxin system
MFSLEYTEGALDDLKRLRASDRKRVIARIDEQLVHTPTQETRNRKVIAGLKPPWDHEEPVWELRTGQLRVFYDVNEADQRVVIRAIREKPPHRTTEEVL